MVRAPRCFLLAAALLAAGGLAAQTVYKSVDEKGNVTYSESPPAKAKPGKTTELPIDTDRNVVPAYVPINTGAPSAPDAAAGGSTHAEQVAAAEAALAAAEAHLQAGQEAQAGDFMGKAGGGVRPSSQRLQRLDELQRAVDEARQNLEKLQGG